MLDAVLGVAGIEDRVRDQLSLGRGKRLGGLRLAGRIFRRDLAEGSVGPGATDIGIAGAHRRRAGDDAVELFGIARRREHAFAAPGRAPREIGTLCGLAIVMRDDRLGGDRHLADGCMGEVERGFLVLQGGAPRFACSRLNSWWIWLGQTKLLQDLRQHDYYLNVLVQDAASNVCDEQRKVILDQGSGGFVFRVDIQQRSLDLGKTNSRENAVELGRTEDRRYAGLDRKILNVGYLHAT